VYCYCLVGVACTCWERLLVPDVLRTKATNFWHLDSPWEYIMCAGFRCMSLHVIWFQGVFSHINRQHTEKWQDHWVAWRADMPIWPTSSDLKSWSDNSSQIWIWVFPKIGVPQNGWFIMETPIKMDDLGGKPTIFGNIHINLWMCFFYQDGFSWIFEPSYLSRKYWQPLVFNIGILILDFVIIPTG